jgi:hypothetical protein
MSEVPNDIYARSHKLFHCTILNLATNNHFNNALLGTLKADVYNVRRLSRLTSLIHEKCMTKYNFKIGKNEIIFKKFIV